MKTLNFIIFYLLLINSNFSQTYLLEDDFESYPVGTLIHKIDKWKSSYPSLEVSTEKAKSGAKSLLLNKYNGSRVTILEYEDLFGDFEVSFNLWNEEGNAIEISPEISFPFLRIRDNGFIYSTFNNGIESNKIQQGKWNKIKMHCNDHSRVWSFYINEKLIARGFYDQVYKRRLTLNNIKDSKIYIDDFKVELNELKPQKNDISISSYSVNSFNLINLKDSLSINVKNEGSISISGISIKYKYGNVEKINELNDFKLDPDSEKSIVIEKEFFSSLGPQNLEIDVALLNAAEIDLNDNSITLEIVGTEKSNKRILFEYSTSMRTAYGIASIPSFEKYSREFGKTIIPLNVHLYDALEAPNYNLINTSGNSELFLDKEENFTFPYRSKLIDLLAQKSIVDIELDLNYDQNLKKHFLNSTLYFNESYNNNLYHNILIVEDSIMNISSDYNQYNGYAFGFSEFYGYELKSEWISASEMTYRNVVRDALFGNYGSKISQVSQTQNSTLKFHNEIPLSKYNPTTQKLYLVSIISDKNRKILNSEIVRIPSNISTNIENKYFDDISIFPNPTSEYLNIKHAETNYESTIRDVNGKVVNFDKNNDKINVKNLTNGIYFLTISTKEMTKTYRFIKSN